MQPQNTASVMIFGIIFLRSPLKGQSRILRWKNEWHIRSAVWHGWLLGFEVEEFK
jgi:hypothetical protein